MNGFQINYCGGGGGGLPGGGGGGVNPGGGGEIFTGWGETEDCSLENLPVTGTRCPFAYMH